jgi:hypothetical protein
MDVQATKVALQKARMSRAYLDQAKSFGMEQDIEFCPCLDSASIEAYNHILINNNLNSANMRQQNHSNIDSASIFKILAAAANINNAKNSNANVNNYNINTINNFHKPNANIKLNALKTNKPMDHFANDINNANKNNNNKNRYYNY